MCLDKQKGLLYIVLMNVLLDASAIMAIILDEPNRDEVVKLTKGAMILAPEVISFEIGNALVNLHRKNKIDAEELLGAYENFALIPLRIVKIDVAEALKISCRYNIYAYDAYYLEIARRLNLPLITFDVSMKKVGRDMKINIPEDAPKQGGENEGF